MKTFIPAAAALAVFAGCSHANQNQYTLEGEIEGIPDSCTVVLTQLGASSHDTIAEIQQTNGKFSYTGTAEEPRLAFLSVKGMYGNKRFILENGKTKFQGKISPSEIQPQKYNVDFNDVAVTGSLRTDTLDNLFRKRREIDSTFLAMRANYSDIMERMSTEGRTEELTSSPRFKAMIEEEQSLFRQLDENYRNTVLDNKDSYWGPLMMLALVNYMSPDNRPLYDELGQKAKDSYYGQMVYALLYPVGKPGDKMKGFTGQNPSRETVSFEEVCKANKYVLIDFWASWCRPCRAEIPNIKAIYDKHHADGFEIISVSIDDDNDAWLRAVENEGLVWPNLRDADDSIADNYKVSAVPTMYLVDSEGRLVAENLRGQELAAKVDELFAE